jgi:hypothetical protein
MKHGIKAYRGGCRCVVCRRAKAEENARYRLRHRRTNPPPGRISEPEPPSSAAKAAFCREWDCDRPATSTGFCRMHSR